MAGGWLYAGMQNTDIVRAPLVNCPICPLTDGTEIKMRPGPARPSQWSLAGPHFRPDRGCRDKHNYSRSNSIPGSHQNPFTHVTARHDVQCDFHFPCKDCDNI